MFLLTALTELRFFPYSHFARGRRSPAADRLTRSRLRARTRADEPLVFATTDADCFHNEVNTGWNAASINPAMFQLLPGLAYDSFLTIRWQNSTGSPHPMSVMSEETDLTQSFRPDGSSCVQVIDDETGGAIYSTLTDPPYQIGADEVLIAQLCSKSSIEVHINGQVFLNSDATQDVRTSA